MGIHTKLHHLSKLYGRTLSLALAIMAGVLQPQAHVLSFLIKYLIVAMLFLSFLDMKISRNSFHKSLIWVLLANLTIPFVAFMLLQPIDVDLALVAFMSGIAPTAISGPVVMGFLAGQVEYIAAAVLLNNISIALVIPFALPLVIETQIEISTWEILPSVALVVFVPLILTHAVSYLPQQAQTLIRRGKALSFPLWILTLFIVSAEATFSFLHEVSVPQATLVQVALISLAICSLNFVIGALLGGKEYRREASQSLGHKNISFTIWLTLTFVNPLVALGPTFYVVYHNLYNSLQLHFHERKRTSQKI